MNTIDFLLNDIRVMSVEDRGLPTMNICKLNDVFPKCKLVLNKAKADLPQA
jgi:hypothetical protein